MTTIRTYLRLLAEAGSHSADLLLRFGTSGVTSPRPAGLRLGEPRRCYANAADLAFRASRYVYVEGYAVCPDVPFPLDHAWVYDLVAGAHYDPTWPEADASFVGIAVRASVLRRVLRRSGWHGVLGVNFRYLLSDPAEYLASPPCSLAVETTVATTLAR